MSVWGKKGGFCRAEGSGETTSAPLVRSGASGTARHSLRAAAASISLGARVPAPAAPDRDLAAGLGFCPRGEEGPGHDREAGEEGEADG